MVNQLIQYFPDLYPWVWFIGLSCLLTRETWRYGLGALVFLVLLVVLDPPQGESNPYILWGRMGLELLAVGLGAWSITRFPYYFSDTAKYRVAVVVAIVGFSSFTAAFYVGYQKGFQEQFYYEQFSPDSKPPSDSRV